MSYRYFPSVFVLIAAISQGCAIDTRLPPDGAETNKHSLDFFLDGYVSLEDFDFNGDLTVMVWARPQTYMAAIIGKYDGPTGGFEININSVTGQIVVHTRENSPATTLWSPSPIPLDVWTHVAVTVSSAGNTCLYLNGALVASAVLLPPLNTPVETLIGRSSWGGNGFTGQIDEVVVYENVLSEDEISSRMTRLLDPDVEIGLRGYWSFENNALNLVGSGFDGTLVGFTEFSTTVPF